MGEVRLAMCVFVPLDGLQMGGYIGAAFNHALQPVFNLGGQLVGVLNQGTIGKKQVELHPPGITQIPMP